MVAMTLTGREARDVVLGRALAGVSERADAARSLPPEDRVALPAVEIGNQPIQEFRASDPAAAPRRPNRSANTWVERKRPRPETLRLRPRPVSVEPVVLPRPKGGAFRTSLEWVSVLGGALLAALMIKLFLFQAFLIPSPSMVTTLEIGNRVLVNKLSYRLHDLHRGDVVVFHRPPAAQSPGDTSDLIKRVIGLPGESIDCSGGHVTINGVVLEEPWLPRPLPTDNCGGPHIVGEHEFFAMGDNRPSSRDSRYFGMVDQDLIVGRAFLLIWPVDRVRGL